MDSAKGVSDSQLLVKIQPCKALLFFSAQFRKTALWHGL